MTYRASIAERIAWSLGQLRSADGKVLGALWSCGDYETGQNCRPYLSTLVERSEVSQATVTRCLRRLEDRNQVGGPWIVARSRRHRHATSYDIVVDRLATHPPQRQQMSISAMLRATNFDAQNEQQTGSAAQNEQQGTRSDAQNEQPTSDPDLDLKRSHTPRAIEPELPLIGQTPPSRCLHPHKHAWCEGRVHVPKDLHFELLDKLDTRPGESPAMKAGRLVAFYAATDASIPATQAIGVDAYTFWKKAFAAAFPFEFEQPRVDGQAARVRYGPAPTHDYDSPAAAARRLQQDEAQRWDDARAAEAIAAIEAMDPAAYAALRAEAEDDHLKQFKPRMLPDAYAEALRIAMIKILVDRARAGERAARSRSAGASAS